MQWLFVDDSEGDRDSLASALIAKQLRVEAISGGQTRERLGRSDLRTSGILMDIDLSNEEGNVGSGLGLTADIRAAQYREEIPSFPIVRFSFREQVARNIGRDSSSDDLFDLKMDKDNLDSTAAVRTLTGVGDVYSALAEPDSDLTDVFGLDQQKWQLWGNPDFEKDFAGADRKYLKARLVVQSLLFPGMLVCEDMLAARLGIHRERTQAWVALRTEAASSFGYRGAGANSFPRWWARGLEMWWDELNSESPLAAATVQERHGLLAEQFPGLQPLQMPTGSPGSRPWRRCEMVYEATGKFSPVDPSRAVGLHPPMTFPVWIDPMYASLGQALRHTEDPRLNKGDLSRLRSLIGDADA